MTFTLVHARRLLKLASAVARSKLYDQRTLGDVACGTPGCLIGHAYAVFPVDSHHNNLEKFFGLAEPEAWNCNDSLFSSVGCGDAGTDRKKAAKFVRDFVKRKLRERDAAR